MSALLTQSEETPPEAAPRRDGVRVDGAEQAAVARESGTGGTVRASESGASADRPLDELRGADGTTRRRDAAIALPFLGLFLLVSPILSLVAASGRERGDASIILYLFGVWAALILAAFALRSGARGGTR